MNTPSAGFPAPRRRRISLPISLLTGAVILARRPEMPAGNRKDGRL
jgi:hypothetical protein